MYHGLFKKPLGWKNAEIKRSSLVTGVLILLIIFPSSGHAVSLMEDSAKKEHDLKDPSSQSCPLNPADIAAAQAYLLFREIKATHIPRGVPDVYGAELGISFDKVQEAINKVRGFGPTYGANKIVLEGKDLKRYISIGSKIACEYCCKATTLVRQDGVAACGCAHSIMMRGLAAKLIKTHPEFSDKKILGELNSWKKTFFPKQTLMAKLLTMKKQGKKGIDQIMKEFPEFMPQMVGGC